MQANGVLVDTSSWVDHLRHGSPALVALLEEGRVLCHPFVIGEFALGSLHQRQEILSLLTELPQAPVLDHDEAMALVDLHQLWSRGVGWNAAHTPDPRAPSGLYEVWNPGYAAVLPLHV